MSSDRAASLFLNVVLPELHPGRVFAGVSTALDAGAEIALRLDVPMRVITLNGRITTKHVEAAQTYLQDRYGKVVPFIVRSQLSDLVVSPSDYWLCTHWVTAHAASVAAMENLIDPRRAIYLIQDYEPGFHAWSTSFEISRDTYHRGFEPLVNSKPLAEYLMREGVAIPPGSVFAPHLNVEDLRSVGDNRGQPGRRVLFYGRPSKPRNMFDLGVAALRRAVAEDFEGLEDIEFVSAGEAHPDIDLGRGKVLRSVGVLDWDGYLSLLASSSVVLSLQGSPHPSHPPLEAAITGARAVTNDFAGARRGLHDRINAVPADPESLGSALLSAIRDDLATGTAAFNPDFGDKLGISMAEAIDNVVARLA